jgi:hypothetical protein
MSRRGGGPGPHAHETRLDDWTDRFGWLNDVRFHGRYWGQSGHAFLHCTCLLLTQSGHPPSGEEAEAVRCLLLSLGGGK